MAQLTENAKNSEQGSLEKICSFFRVLGDLIVAVTKLDKLLNLIVAPSKDLKEEHGEYDDLRKVLSGLAVDYKKLKIELKSRIKTLKEQAQTSTKIIEEAERLLVEGKNISDFLLKIQAMTKSQTSFEELRKKFDAFIDQVKDCLSKAKAGYERNERKGGLVQEVSCIGCCLGGCIGGIICGYKAFAASMGLFGLHGALVVVALGILGGFIAGSLMVDWPLAKFRNLYQKQAKKSKSLYATSDEIIQILLEDFEGLNDICQQLGKLKTQDTSNTIRQDGNSHNVDHEDTVKNPDFLIQLSLDSCKKTCGELEKSCDCFLGDIHLDYSPDHRPDLLPASEKCNGDTTGKNKKDN